jgi:hypothetical protein
VLGDVLLVIVSVVVGIDEGAPLDTIASFQTFVDSFGEGVGHVRWILGGGPDGLTLPMAVRSDDLVIEVLDLVVAFADRVIARLGRFASPWEIGELVSTEADVQAESGKDRLALDRVSAIPERLDNQSLVAVYQQ